MRNNKEPTDAENRERLSWTFARLPQISIALSWIGGYIWKHVLQASRRRSTIQVYMRHGVSFTPPPLLMPGETFSHAFDPGDVSDLEFLRPRLVIEAVDALGRSTFEPITIYGFGLTPG